MTQTTSTMTGRNSDDLRTTRTEGTKWIARSLRRCPPLSLKVFTYHVFCLLALVVLTTPLAAAGGSFELHSPVVAEAGALPVRFTCDGTANTLPLVWSNEPAGTKSFAVIMHHVAPDAIHWYWLVWNIPATVHELPENMTGVGTLGSNSVNDKGGYSPPCSKGPGQKTYTYTVYALSAAPQFSKPPVTVTRDDLLAAINGLTLGSAALNVTYSRTGDQGGSGPGPGPAPTPGFTVTQSISDLAQRTTLAFSALAMMTGNLDAQSFFPPGKVADYTGFQYLRDNDPDSMGHNTSFLTRVANNIISILNDTQFEQLKTLAVGQLDEIDLYAYKRFPLMKAFRRLMDGDVPAGSKGLNLEAVKEASRELYALDGQISFDRALLYANILSSMTPSQKSHLDAMKGQGWNSWPDISDEQVSIRMKGLPQGTAVAVMTYASDLFSWYAGSVDADVYFCPERHGTYYGGFYIKAAPAIGHEGYGIDEQLTATAGSALCDSSQGYVTEAQAAAISNLVETQRDNLYASPTANIVGVRTQIASLLRGLMTSTSSADAAKAQVLALSNTYGDLDGENNYHYATVFAQVYRTLTAEQKAKLAALRKTIMSGTYADGTPFDYSVCTTPFLYSATIKDATILAPYVNNTDYLFLTSAGTAPSAAFTFSPSAPTTADTVAFKDTSIGNPTSWSWSFGDGASSTAQNPSHVYPQAGTFTVMLTAQNAFGSTTVSKTLVVGIPVQGGSIALGAGGAAVGEIKSDSSRVRVGFGGLTVLDGQAPYATAVFSLTQNGRVVSQVASPASPPATESCLFVDYRTASTGAPAVNTGVAVVNPGKFSASLTFTLRDSQGTTVATGHVSLAAKGRFAKLVSELAQIAPDFVLPAAFPVDMRFGSLTVSSDQRVSIVPLRLTINQRGDALLTSTPILDVSSAPADDERLYFAQFAEGAGWRTTIVLLNHHQVQATGRLSLFDDGGAPLAVRDTNGSFGSSFEYSVAPRGVYVFQTDGTLASPKVGAARVMPMPGSVGVFGAGILSYVAGQDLIVESGIPASTPTTHARILVDTTRGTSTGLGIANPSDANLNLTVRAYGMDGVTPVTSLPMPVVIKGNGHLARYTDDLVPQLPVGFTGVLDLSSDMPFAALTLGSLFNGRDHIYTVLPVADLTRPAPTPIVFPQIAAGGGYSTEVILISAGGAAVTRLDCQSEDGLPLTVETRKP